ncbi:MFS transporter [Streptomyces sp. NPDC058665]|uniref:MFS transporter n=1 Tax=Streptomyces sp. NPDC058665 TaxID=3346586 RepID=UPI00364D4BBC
MLRVHDPFLRGQLATAALFSSLGFQYATWASRIPAFKADLHLTSAEVGFFLMAAGVGAAVSFPLVAYLMRRLGSQRLALLSALGLTLMLLALSVAPNYPVALLVMGVDGVLVGCLNTAMNAQGAALETTYGRNTMAKLHATFSAGSFAAALLASGMNAVTSSVVAHFGVAALLLVILAACARTGLLPDEGAPADTEEKKTSRTRTGWTLPTGVTLWMCCAMAFGTVAEGAMNDWSTLYMEDIALASEQVAPLGIAVVSGAMVAARLLADGWRARWGDGRVVVLGSVVAGVGLGTALLAGGVIPALLGFGAVGLGVAAVTPCVYVAAAKRGSDTLTLVAAMGTTGLLAGPPLIGFVANASSLAWGLGLVCVCAFVVTLCATRIPWETPAPKSEPLPAD